MKLRSLTNSSLAELDARSGAFMAACGYETRSVAVSKRIQGVDLLTALCFEEWPHSLARPRNEREFMQRGFALRRASGHDSLAVQMLVADLAKKANAAGKSTAFDISSMTRAWHGGVVRQLSTMELESPLETFFAYVPALFKAPPKRTLPNEIVAPVDGFASLVAPDLPIAAVIGLGYERERATGLQQSMDPELTVLMLPKSSDTDPYYRELVQNNRSLLERTEKRWIFEYQIEDPAGTLSTLASVVAGLREDYRVVLTSLGPKIYGLLCLLLASTLKDVSVWRVSSGAHGKPRDAEPDLERFVVAKAVWEPN